MKLLNRIKKGLKHKRSNIVAALTFVAAIILVWFDKATLTQACTALPVMFTFLMYKGKEKECED